MADPSPSVPASADIDAKHLAYMRHALDLARQSPPKPSNFRVGAVLVDATVGGDTSSDGAVLATGYTLELPGNTHAEQCCLLKLAAQHGVTEEELSGLSPAQLPTRLAIYTTMEPCSVRLSGNLPCVQRLLRLIGSGEPGKPDRTLTVYLGVAEPDTFVANNTGRQTLAGAGVQVVHVSGLEQEILAVATAGHEQ